MASLYARLSCKYFSLVVPMQSRPLSVFERKGLYLVWSQLFFWIQYYSLKVTGLDQLNRKITPGCVSICFDVKDMQRSRETFFCAKNAEYLLSISFNMCFGCSQDSRLTETVLLSTQNICFG